MTLAEMKTALKRYGFDDSDPLTTWINWGIDSIQDEWDWRWLEQEGTIDGIEGSGFLLELTPQQQIQRINWIRARYDTAGDIEGPPLEFMPRRLFQVMAAGQAKGSPYYYTASFGDEHVQVVVYPSPPTLYTYNFNVQLKEQHLSDSFPNDSPSLIPEGLHRAIVIRAAAHGFEAENEEDRANTLMGTYGDIITKAINRQPKTAEPLSVQDTQGYGN